jgi:ribosome-associated toxin RatA of RatAB toxin-antitoxin module
MFDLVDDVESYPEFLPWCHSAEVLSRDGDESTASLLLSRGGVRSRFSTRNRVIVDEQIDIELLNGPFDHLHGRWRFDASSDRTHVSLDIRYQFSNPLAGLLFATVVEDIAVDLIHAFRDRARDVYVG